MTMLSRTRHGAWLARSGVLALTLAALVPFAAPVAASASPNPGFPSASSGLGGFEFTNQVKAFNSTDQHTVFNVKFNAQVSLSSVLTATNHAEAQTSNCSDCNAIAIGLQVVTTTALGFTDLHAHDVAVATDTGCVSKCNAVADAYQIVVATDTPQAISFSGLLTIPQQIALAHVRSEFNNLPKSGLTLAQIQSKCEDLANQVVSIMEDATYGTSYTAFTVPTFSPAVHGAAPTATQPQTSGEQPVVKLYKDIQFVPAG
jgi:hypothetical protein